MAPKSFTQMKDELLDVARQTGNHDEIIEIEKLTTYSQMLPYLLDYYLLEEGIPFSSADESKGTAFQERAIQLVENHLEELDKKADSIYIVLFAYILGNWKATVSTSIEDGLYYEITYNAAKSETYFDVYAKISNTVISG